MAWGEGNSLPVGGGPPSIARGPEDSIRLPHIRQIGDFY